MATFFLVILILTMIAALSSGFPVAFALPGSAVLSILLAALCGYLFAGNPSEYFIQMDQYNGLLLVLQTLEEFIGKLNVIH